MDENILVTKLPKLVFDDEAKVAIFDKVDDIIFSVYTYNFIIDIYDVSKYSEYITILTFNSLAHDVMNLKAALNPSLQCRHPTQ
jgi:hypothetical protein